MNSRISVCPNSGALAMLACLAATTIAAESPRSHTLRVPDGFTIERVAGPPLIRFPMFGALDDRGRLFITESGGGDLYDDLVRQKRTCRVSLLEDRDGDGRFEAHRVFAEPFVPSMGIVWHAGILYVADPPDLVTLEDTDHDGRADRRTVLLSGFGHTDNGSLHGLVFGPDGKLYITMGWPDGFHVTGRDGSSVRGKTGALLRCRPDGSRLQVVARGFDQLIELAFLPGGQIIGSQTWYQNPSAGIRDALTHLVPEGFYPQRWQDEQPRVFVTGDTLPALLLLPAVAHSGITLYRGLQFPSEWRGQLFSAQFNTRKVVRHPLLQDGSTFRAETHDFVTTDDPDFRPSDVIEDADGSLLVLDTGSWYVQHCPTGRMRASAAPGGIYRVRHAPVSPATDPRGSMIDWPRVSAPELVDLLLDSSRPMVRDRAVEHALRLRAEGVSALAEALKRARLKSTRGATTTTNPPDSPEPEHTAGVPTEIVWALGRMRQPESWRVLHDFVAGARLSSVSSSRTGAYLLAAAVRALGWHANPESASTLQRLLLYPDAAVQLAAAEALATSGQPQSTPAIITALASSPDRLLEHTLSVALRAHASESDLRAALTHPSPVVQKAALLVLAQPPHRSALPTDALTRLNSTNEPLRRAAQFCLRLYPDWSAQAQEFIQRELRAPSSASPVQTNLLGWLHSFPPDESLVATVSRALLEPDATVAVSRKAALLRFLRESPHGPWPPICLKAIAAALQHSAPEIRAEAVRVAVGSNRRYFDNELAELAHDNAENTVIRLEALASIARQQPALDAAAFDFLLAQITAPEPSPDRWRAAEIFATTRPPAAALQRFIAAASADSSISPTLALAAAERATLDSASTANLLDYLTKSVQRGWPIALEQLDPLLGRLSITARDRAGELAAAIRNQAEQQRALLRKSEPLLVGGDSGRGRVLFFGKAQCSTCHTAGDQGRAVGPDLTKLGAIRSGRDILESVLVPSATFAQGFETYVAETSDGEPVTGSLVSSLPDFIVLRNASGAESRLRRSEIQSLNTSRFSMMPEGLLEALTRNETSDLFAFLQDLR